MPHWHKYAPDLQPFEPRRIVTHMNQNAATPHPNINSEFAFDWAPREALGEPVFAVEGNRFRVVYDPDDRIDAAIRLIEQAQISVRAFYYMVRDDESGARLLQAMRDAVARGVTVSLGIDGFGSNDTAVAWFEEQTKDSIDFFIFSSRRSMRALIRNHQKMLIIDGDQSGGVALIGGFNITDYYFGMKGAESWADMGMVVAGPAVGDLVGYYDDFKAIAYDGKARLRNVRRLLREHAGTTGAVRWVYGGPVQRLSPWSLNLKRDLQGAKRADIVAAYFSPGRGLLKRMGRISKKGGTMRLMLAGRSDNGTTINASRLTYKYLVKRGAEVFEYQKTCLHMKMLVIDDACYVGSANLDPRSLYLNLEIMLRVESPELAAHLRKLFDGMVVDADEQTAEVVRKRSGPFTWLRQALSYLIVGVLDYSVTRSLAIPLPKVKD